MPEDEMITNEKKMAANSAAKLIKDGMIIGIGTGSTANFVIQSVAKRIKDEGLKIIAVPTSYETELLAIKNKIPLTSLSINPALDLAIDGADQVDKNLFTIKGKGGAHTREKVVSMSAKKFVVCIDETKIVDVLFESIPIEVIPYAKDLVEKEIRGLGGIPKLRKAQRKIGPVISENGNIIIDSDFGEIKDPKKLSSQISSFAGVVEHGIFTNLTEVHIGKRDGIEIIS